MTPDLLACVPKDKHDFAAVDRAEVQGFSALEPVPPELLMWLQDINWPAAPRIAVLLSRADPALVPALRAVLRSGDGDWEAFALEYLVRQVPPESLIALRSDLERLARDPTAEEGASGAAAIAWDLIKSGFEGL